MWDDRAVRETPLKPWLDPDEMRRSWRAKAEKENGGEKVEKSVRQKSRKGGGQPLCESGSKVVIS